MGCPINPACLVLNQTSSFQILILKQIKPHSQPSEPPGSFCPKLLRIAKPIKINRFTMLTAFSALGPFTQCLPKKKKINSKSTKAVKRPVAKTAEVRVQEILEGCCSQWEISCSPSQPCSAPAQPQKGSWALKPSPCSQSSSFNQWHDENRGNINYR